MSDPTAEVPARRDAPSGREPAPARESPAGVLGILLGLALIGAAAWLALRPAARPVGAGAALERAFELSDLPFGLELEAAALLPGGVQVVSFAGERARGLAFTTELEPHLEPAEEEVGPLDPDGQGKVDWGALEPREPGGPPARLVLVRWPPERADAERRARFQNVRFRTIEDLPAGGGAAPLERTTLAWSGLEARAVRERHFRLESGTDPGPGRPSFVDSVRVDLARPSEAWMMVAIWPPRHPATIEPVAGLLQSFRPRRAR